MEWITPSSYWKPISAYKKNLQPEFGAIRICYHFPDSGHSLIRHKKRDAITASLL